MINVFLIILLDCLISKVSNQLLYIQLLIFSCITSEIIINNKMLKDFFQKNIQLQNQLRSQHFKVSEYLSKGKYRMKQKFFGGGKKHYDFDMNSQQFFHQYKDDIIFQNAEIQDIFMNHITKAIDSEANFTKPMKSPEMPHPKNPYQTRISLARHFRCRMNDLLYKKYLTMNRLHNTGIQQQIQVIRSRVHLIQRQIQACLERQNRLSCEDMFQQSFTQGGKPVPVNQNNQPIYKYLDQEDCWFTNIARQDIIVYSRRKTYIDRLLQQTYWPVHYQMEALVFTYGINILNAVQADLAAGKSLLKKKIEKQAIQFVSMLEVKIQEISPGNLVEKQNITNFVYFITGVNKQKFLHIPIYPAIKSQILKDLNDVIPLFFKNLTISDHQKYINALPKLNTFCSILFKYQNKQILQGKKQIKLGLDDDVDVRKQLITMLQQLWVRKHVDINFDRFQYKLVIRKVDWPLDTISIDMDREARRDKADTFQQYPDRSIQQLIRLVRLTDYSVFRKHMKKRSQDVVKRAGRKYLDMEQVNRYNQKSTQTITLQKLSELYKAKLTETVELPKILKGNAINMFNAIIQAQTIDNPAQVQVIESLKCIHIRQDRTKILNILNAMRAYHRNVCFDLRVLGGQQFKFELDDNFLVNSNKQTVENFQKAVKDTTTTVSKGSGQSLPKIQDQEFLGDKKYYKKSMLFKKDIPRQQFFDSQIPHVIVSDGQRPKNNILYDISLSDLQNVERKLIKEATNFINRHERIVKVKQMAQLVDRVELLKQLFDCELRYQYQKFKLIEQYYWIYENTSEPLQAFKIAKIIVELLHRKADIDLEDQYFLDSYEYCISQLKEQTEAVKLFVEILTNNQFQQNKGFHKKFAENAKIPLTLYAFLYGDLQGKQKKHDRLSRMNSQMSMKSKASNREDPLKRLQNAKRQIKQQFAEDSDYQDTKGFDIEKYDEFLLQKDMDTIFDDMIQNNTDKEAPINTVAMENLIVNPRFQGGPHPQNYLTHEVFVNSNRKQFLTNFSDILFWAANIRRHVENLCKQFQRRYGYCSKLYQNAVSKVITSHLLNILRQPENKPQKWFEFTTDDPYQEIVTKCMRFYQETLAPALDPPSQAQMLVQNSIKIHQDKLPGFSVLQHFDFHTLTSLCVLKRPLNCVNYKQVILGINFIQFLDLLDKLWHTQLQRKRTSRAYKTLGNHSDCFVDKYGMQYIRGAQTQVFLACQQLKAFNLQLTKYPVLPDSLTQIRTLIMCQLADVELFKTCVQISKLHLEDFIIMKYEVDKEYLNWRLDKKRLLSLDPKNIKMIKNRVVGLVATIASERLKNQSFLKAKSKIKTQFQRNLQSIEKVRIEQHVKEEKSKLSPGCLNLLEQKYKHLLLNHAIVLYLKDLMATVSRNQVLISLDFTTQRINNYVNSLPNLAKVFNTAVCNFQLEKKIFYDQKAGNFSVTDYSSIFKQGQIEDSVYICSREHLLSEWVENSTGALVNNSLQFTTQGVVQLHPPKDKNNLFEWIFRVRKNSLSTAEKEALRHFLTVAQSFTGTVQQTYYSTNQLRIPAPPRNKYLTLLEHYQNIFQYLQANTLIVSLQFQEDIFESLHNLILRNRNFEATYPQHDQSTSLQNLNTHIIAPCFVYESKESQLQEMLKKKFADRRYSEQKQYCAVIDEIIDFIISKVQGFGVIRQSFIPLAQQIKVALKTPKVFDQFLKEKTKICYSLLWLGIWQNYCTDSMSKDQSDFHNYLFPLLNQISNNGKVETFKICTDPNLRINIENKISYKTELQKQRFRLGVYDKTTNSVTQKIKPTFMCLPNSLQTYLRNEIAKYESQNLQENPLIQRFDLFQDSQIVFKRMGSQNRMSIFGRIRMFNDAISSYIVPRELNMKPVTKIAQKASYAKFLIDLKVQLLSCIIFDRRIDFSKDSSQGFRQKLGQIHQICDMNAYTIYTKFEDYKSAGKILLGKTDNMIIGKCQTEDKNQFNKAIRQVIYKKLVREQFKTRLLNYNIKCIKLQKYPVNEPKKIINTSLIPRVHLIASYSSPLIVDRKTYISQQYKLAFVQAFTNRFRNKVSRVDLLSSGYGFVITVPDLEDCLNYMNKLIFTFTQKEFKFRMETFSQYYQILIDAVRSKDKRIADQNAIINYLQDKLHNIKETQYLGKVSKLLAEKTIIEDKLKQVQKSSQGLEDRVRKTIQIQYEKQILKMQKQNAELRRQFDQYKKIMVILTKDTTKNNFLNIVNDFKERVNDLLNKKVDLTQSLIQIQKMEVQAPSENVKVAYQSPRQTKSNKYRSPIAKSRKQQDEQQDEQIDERDIQKCRIGEDIIHDPYYVTKLINKMRLFNLFKLGSKRLKFEKDQTVKNRQIGQLMRVQDTVIMQSEKEAVMRQQLIKAQEELSRKYLQLEQMKNTCETLENQKTKLKILLTAKDKKLQQKDRQLDESKKNSNNQVVAQNSNSKSTHSNNPSFLSTLKVEQKLEKPQQLPKISTMRDSGHKKSLQKKLEKLSFVTNPDQQSMHGGMSGGITIYDKFQLSNKDATWREKCEQLYIENKRLMAELDKIQTGATVTPIPIRDGYSLNMKPNRRSADSSLQIGTPVNKQGRKKFPNLSFKYSIVKQNHSPYGF